MSKKILNKTKESRKTPLLGVLSVKANKADSSSCRESVTLYRFVYRSRTSVMVAFMLFVSFFVQGVQNVYASEELAVSDVEVSQESYPATESSVETSTTPELETSEIVEEVIEDTLVDMEVSDEEVLDTEEVNVVEEDVLATTTEGVLVNSSTSTEEVDDVDVSEQDSETLDDGVEDEDLNDEIVAEAELTHETISFNESDSAFSFTSDECTQLATGSFYCQKPQENVLEDALFSAPDSDGDTEIFLVRGGVQVQVTHNKVDDDAPYYDQNSNTIVWHRFVNDRFQIISYDVDTQEEVQMTQTSENNMEPTRQGNYTVWQRWVDGGWNIVMNDGNKETQITRTSSHNVAPYIHGSLIVWNRHSASGEKTIEMYDIASKNYVTVNDPEGMAVSNPRMVFVYDSMHPNGDIVTKGYDVLAQKFIELGTLPRQLPEEIPDTDSTGETRAMIQSKPSIKSEVVTVNSSSTPPVVDLPADLVVSTSSDEVSEPNLELDNSTTTEEVVVTAIDLNSGTNTEEFVDSALDSEVDIENTSASEEIEEFIMPTEDITASNSVQE